jgi:hypothetical protein
MSIFRWKDNKQPGSFAESREKVSPTMAAWKIVWGKALAAVLILAKQLASTKLEFGDLRKANYRIGKRAYEGGILLAGHEDLTARLIDLQISITALKDKAHGDASTLPEKARVALRNSIKIVRSWVLGFKQNRLLTELGAELRQTPQGKRNWTAEVDLANEISKQMRGLEEQIAKLQDKTYRWARRPLWIVGTFLMGVAAWVGVGMVTSSTDRPGVLLVNEHKVPPALKQTEVKSADLSSQQASAKRDRAGTPAVTPAPTPELDPRMNNLAQFTDMLKQAFDTTQNKQSVEQFMGHFAQDLMKMKKVPGDVPVPVSTPDDWEEADRQRREQFNRGMEMIRQDDEERERQREREQEQRDRQQQYLDQQQRNQRNGY